MRKAKRNSVAIAPGFVPARARSIVVAAVLAVESDDRARRAGGMLGRYADASVTVTDAAGSFTSHLTRGGIWNDREGRAAVGLTKADVASARALLRAAGFRASFEDVDAILAQATYEDWAHGDPFSNEPATFSTAPAPAEGAVAFVPRPKKEGPMSDVERARLNRERRSLLGLCSRCPAKYQNPAAPGKTVCEACNSAAKERVAAGRARRKKL